MSRPREVLYGPFHRLQSKDLNRRVEASGKLWGKPARNIYAGRTPCVKAYEGPLPQGRTGIEFYTPIKPGLGSQPGKARWFRGEEGVEEINGEEAVAIPVRITRRVD